MAWAAAGRLAVRLGNRVPTVVKEAAKELGQRVVEHFPWPSPPPSPPHSPPATLPATSPSPTSPPSSSSKPPTSPPSPSSKPPPTSPSSPSSKSPTSPPSSSSKPPTSPSSPSSTPPTPPPLSSSVPPTKVEFPEEDVVYPDLHAPGPTSPVCTVILVVICVAFFIRIQFASGCGFEASEPHVNVKKSMNEINAGKKFKTCDLRTGNLIAEVAEGDSGDINRAVPAARKAFDEGPWPKMTTYAYECQIVHPLIVDIVPDVNVKRAMNETNAGRTRNLRSAVVSRYSTGAAVKEPITPPVKVEYMKLLITGQLVDSASGKKFKTFDPRTGNLIAEGDVEDINRAVAAARKAFDEGPYPCQLRAMNETNAGFFPRQQWCNKLMPLMMFNTVFSLIDSFRAPLSVVQTDKWDCLC